MAGQSIFDIETKDIKYKNIHPKENYLLQSNNPPKVKIEFYENINNLSQITCFSNDFGYENWLTNAIKFYCDRGDILFLVSVSGNSKNIVNAAKNAKKYGIKKIITFTGCQKNNPVSKLGDINFWVNSEAYNLVENYHQFLLLSLVDLIIGKSEYSPN